MRGVWGHGREKTSLLSDVITKLLPHSTTEDCEWDENVEANGIERRCARHLCNIYLAHDWRQAYSVELQHFQFPSVHVRLSVMVCAVLRDDDQIRSAVLFAD